MIRFEILRPPEDFPMSLEAGDGAESQRAMPFSAPLYFAEHCEAGDVLLWQDAGVVGLISSKVRREWQLAEIDLVQICSMQPGTRPGVVGLEIGVVGEEEEPVLAFEGFSREALDWLKAQREVLAECFGVPVPVVDYGRDG